MQDYMQQNAKRDWLTTSDGLMAASRSRQHALLLVGGADSSRQILRHPCNI